MAVVHHQPSIARTPQAEAEGRQRGAWILVAFALLLCGSAIAPLGGLDAWLHSHGSIGWHMHVDDGDSRGFHAHSRAIHDHGEHAESSVDHAPPAERSAARASGHAPLSDFASTRLVPQAAATVQLAERASALGEGTVLDLLQAQQALLAARRTELEARHDAARAFIALQRAAGGTLVDAPADPQDAPR